MLEPSRIRMEAARKVLQSKFHPFPEIAVVLGSGFGTIYQNQKRDSEIDFMEIPGFRPPSVDGHSGVLGLSQVGGRRVLWMSGRPHYYEGLSWEEVLFPVRALAFSGVQTFLLTNAAGGLNPEYKVGDLVLIRDHINAIGTNPLRGHHEPFLGPRFPDLTGAYDGELRAVLKQAGKRAGIALAEGIYVGACGPTYETEAEARLYRSWGGDVVGMSTVPETMALRQMGKRVAAVSCVANASSGAGLTHAEVLEKIGESCARFEGCLLEALATL